MRNILAVRLLKYHLNKNKENHQWRMNDCHKLKGLSIGRAVCTYIRTKEKSVYSNIVHNKAMEPQFCG
jgi:hypothetical protein